MATDDLVAAKAAGAIKYRRPVCQTSTLSQDPKIVAQGLVQDSNELLERQPSRSTANVGAGPRMEPDF